MWLKFFLYVTGNYLTSISWIDAFNVVAFYSKRSRFVIFLCEFLKSFLVQQISRSFLDYYLCMFSSSDLLQNSASVCVLNEFWRKFFSVFLSLFCCYASVWKRMLHNCSGWNYLFVSYSTEILSPISDNTYRKKPQEYLKISCVSKNFVIVTNTIAAAILSVRTARKSFSLIQCYTKRKPRCFVVGEYSPAEMRCRSNHGMRDSCCGCCTAAFLSSPPCDAQLPPPACAARVCLYSGAAARPCPGRAGPARAGREWPVSCINHWSPLKATLARPGDVVAMHASPVGWWPHTALLNATG